MYPKKLMTVIQLRWFAALGVLIILALVSAKRAYPIDTSSWYLWAAFVLTNAAASLLARKIPERRLDAAVLILALFDLVYLTLLISGNGGAHNPFSILFIAISATAAFTLSRQYLFLVIAASLACLWNIYGRSHHLHSVDDGGYLFHLKGMWLANSVGVIVVASWIHHLKTQNEKITSKHRESERILSRIERVESMGRLLASAAHQLNTPLATIQLGVSELSSPSDALNENEKHHWLSDMQKALSQIERIFSNFKSTTAEEKTSKTDFSVFLEACVQRWSSARDIGVGFSSDIGTLPASDHALGEIGASLEALLENAYDARRTNVGPEIAVTLTGDRSLIALSVNDNGLGMDQPTLERATEPLFTTKKSGTGLGLYIAHQLAKKMGGSIRIKSAPGEGTKIEMRLNRDYLR